MIEVLLSFGGEMIIVRVEGNSVKFGSTTYGAVETGIEGLKLSHEGVMLEHPDLVGVKDWRKQVIKRFNDKIKSFKSERERADYIIKDLENYGYKFYKAQLVVGGQLMNGASRQHNKHSNNLIINIVGLEQGDETNNARNTKRNKGDHNRFTSRRW